VNATLWMLRTCEGTNGTNGYRTMFGGRLFDNYADHPRQRFSYTDKAGKTYTTSAAGAYQAEEGTWDDFVAYVTRYYGVERLGPLKFSPPNQDWFATWRLQFRGCYTDAQNGRLSSVIQKCGAEWASLPSSPYAQPKRTQQYCLQAYTSAGGVVTD
jgi:lysozyme